MTGRIQRPKSWRVDELVAWREFPSCSQAIEIALAEKGARRTRLARECAKLDPEGEKALAEAGLAGSSDWPEY